MIDAYYHVLELDKNASLSEIKRAYRKKAREMHPDVNQRSDAHEQFIQLTEAYEYLHHLKTGRNYDASGREQKKSTRYRSYNEWAEQEREKAKARARYYARKKYEEFINSEYYQSLVAINLVLDYLAVVFVVAIFIVLAAISIWVGGTGGLIITVLIMLITSPIWLNLIRHLPGPDLREFINALLYLAGSRGFRVTVLLVFNLTVFFTVVTNTLLKPITILAIYALVFIGATSYLAFRPGSKNSYQRLLVYLGIAPGVVSLLFFMNYSFSHGTERETYKVRPYMEETRGYPPYKKGKTNHQTTYILLEGDQYEDYPQIRVFVDYYAMANANRITYIFEEGLFGIRVVKDYEFDTVIR